MCNRSAQRFGLDVVREPAPAVDLDDGQPLPVFGLEGRVAADVDFPQIEAELVAERPHLCERALAQVTAFSVVNGDDGYG
ncbi:MAG TPA: hypothetical protein VKP14_02240 [Gaiellaceae bacterium]|nr:hypothetical protein [Gaiellaceae bacterium]